MAVCVAFVSWPFSFGRLDDSRNVIIQYSSEFECCSLAYGGQTSGACLASLPSPPTGAPSTEVATTFYPDYTKAWNVGVCINDRPVPSGRPQYASKEECCGGAYADQGNQWGSNSKLSLSPLIDCEFANKITHNASSSPDKSACMCDIDPCYSCKCAGDKSNCSGFTVDHPADACP